MATRARCYRREMTPGEHDEDLAAAFDGQAPLFERSPLSSDAAALRRLVELSALPAAARVLDAGCGPGLVAEAFLETGHEVFGVDLSTEMVERARARCARFGARARFERGSLMDLAPPRPFDASVSRFVLHHVEDPLAFLRAQVSRVAPGGVVVASDHVTDPDPAAARWREELERARDRTHTRNLTSGELADAFARAGLAEVRLVEETVEMDFDEWFDRGTPVAAKANVRDRLLAGTARGFSPTPSASGRVAIRCVRAVVRGVRPAPR